MPSGKRNYDYVVLNHLMHRAKTEYKCNRGPRPSGALIERIHEDERKRWKIYGDVKSPIPNAPNCIDDGCMMVNGHCVRNTHAEIDAIIQCAYWGNDTYDTVMYTINKPCYNCTLAIIAAGIKEVRYAYTVYDEERTRILIARSPTKFIHCEVDDVWNV